MPKFWDRIKAGLAAFGQPANERTKAALAAAGVAVDEDLAEGGAAEFAAVTAEAEAARAALQKEREARVRQEAEAFADVQVRDRRALPAEKPALLAAFTRAALDDLENPAVVTFAEGKTGSRVEALKALFAARPQHQLTEEQLRAAAEGGQVLFNGGGDAAKAAARKKELMGMTPLGRACLKKGA